MLQCLLPLISSETAYFQILQPTTRCFYIKPLMHIYIWKMTYGRGRIIITPSILLPREQLPFLFIKIQTQSLFRHNQPGTERTPTQTDKWCKLRITTEIIVPFVTSAGASRRIPIDVDRSKTINKHLSLGDISEEEWERQLAFLIASSEWISEARWLYSPNPPILQKMWFSQRNVSYKKLLLFVSSH